MIEIDVMKRGTGERNGDLLCNAKRNEHAAFCGDARDEFASTWDFLQCIKATAIFLKQKGGK
jgi:hypothetical protein